MSGIATFILQQHSCDFSVDRHLKLCLMTDISYKISSNFCAEYFGEKIVTSLIQCNCLQKCKACESSRTYHILASMRFGYLS